MGLAKTALAKQSVGRKAGRTLLFTEDDFAALVGNRSGHGARPDLTQAVPILRRVNKDALKLSWSAGGAS
jgi:hypothetical protein